MPDSNQIPETPTVIINPYRYAAAGGGACVDCGTASRSFDGSNDYINFGSDASIDDIFDSGGSISFWAKLNGFVNDKRFINKDDSRGTSGREWAIYYGSGELQFEAHFTGNRCLALTIDDAFPGASTSTSQWVHCVVTYTATAGTAPTIYLDSVSQTLSGGTGSTGTRNSDAGDDLIVGSSAGVAQYLDGQMSDIRMYTKILTQEDVDDLFVFNDVTDSLVAHWKLIETGTNPTFADSSTNNNTGTNNGTTESTDGPAD